DNALREEIGRAVAAANSTVSRSESIRVFRVLPEPFDVANGLLTPSMKLRRDEIVRRHALEIDAMYQTRSRPGRPAAAEEPPGWDDPDNVFRCPGRTVTSLTQGRPPTAVGGRPCLVRGMSGPDRAPGGGGDGFVTAGCRACGRVGSVGAGTHRPRSRSNHTGKRRRERTTAPPKPGPGRRDGIRVALGQDTGCRGDHESRRQLPGGAARCDGRTPGRGGVPLRPGPGVRAV